MIVFPGAEPNATDHSVDNIWVTRIRCHIICSICILYVYIYIICDYWFVWYCLGFVLLVVASRKGRGGEGVLAGGVKIWLCNIEKCLMCFPIYYKIYVYVCQTYRIVWKPMELLMFDVVFGRVFGGLSCVSVQIADIGHGPH